MNHLRGRRGRKSSPRSLVLGACFINTAIAAIQVRVIELVNGRFLWTLSAIFTKLKPLDQPVCKSLITLVEVTSPKAEQAARSSLSVVW